ncbi:hydroxyproline-2-epimerase [Alteromonadaceae bacterium M269]|nr:hydroxyproline-2-epimerase [Alteromonadaceae bacterium M269]
MIKVIDSHTAGEPTRVIYDGGPPLVANSLEEQLHQLKNEFDEYRQATILEPRGMEAMVGALLCEPKDERCVTGVIFFNNRGYLGMCGHGAIGVAVTLHHMGRIELGTHYFETPVGVVCVELLTANKVSIKNVESYCYLENVELNVPPYGRITGNVAWGGNWFFLVDESPVPLLREKIPQLSGLSNLIKNALVSEGITGRDGEEIDHIELFDNHISSNADSRNFVLCPGGAYDRSPCGTGTSAKLACLAHKGLLQPGEFWIQESIIGGHFKACYERENTNSIIPTIVGDAFVVSEANLLQVTGDPFIWGIQ